MHIILIFIIAISLSMDAFSLSLAYGTQKMESSFRYKLAITVGIFHFFMPLLGMNLGEIISDRFPVYSHLIVAVILIFIGVNMYADKPEEHKTKILGLKELLLFGFAVSLDSFSVGIGLDFITKKHILSALLFSITSFLFTHLGLKFGNHIEKKIGSISTKIGGLVLIIIGVLHLF